MSTIEIMPVLVQAGAIPWPEGVDREAIADAIQACVQASRFVGCALGDNVYIAGRVARFECSCAGGERGSCASRPRKSWPGVT